MKQIYNQDAGELEVSIYFNYVEWNIFIEV